MEKEKVEKLLKEVAKDLKHKKELAIKAKSTDDTIHKGTLYKRFTYKGSKRKMIHNKTTKTYRYDWGNYLSYVEKANSTFISFNNGNQIKRQLRKTWKGFNKQLVKSLNEIESAKKKHKTIIL